VGAIVLVCAVLFVGDTWFGSGGFCSDASQLVDHIEEDDGDLDAQVAEAEEHVGELQDRADRMIWPWPRGDAQDLAAELQLLADSAEVTSGEPGEASEEALAAYLARSEDFHEAHCSSVG
jgi:hypothetical protein